ncbi:MAG: hypothetical protein A3G66_02055 [Candidatus Levybacteria bacterium RIFCSPLOWO2_12_FULL_39_17]|nr:MAG: hypothetical protein A2689_01465 [Candidatus Levybacteria bacterium RIFCSPHIGHO2_01_FULL_38_96]OGH36271.1 MAG: hypothetical protein A3B43_02540 [Candidatus Levybacteria bacterium RIFCSPLOWO2_01_FULL_38_120]OGH47824.1 MAG: hypothetical protein A3G66_02055 [Candidatus Levybacteria bacterium RIFCSPLOWO2_12_FULL_39_17]
MNQEIFGNPILLLAIYIWSLIWKGLALWRTANLSQRNWFIAILVLNTLGILEIIYLFRFAEKRLTLKEIRSWIQPSK